jgi:hypothetical protein
MKALSRPALGAVVLAVLAGCSTAQPAPPPRPVGPVPQGLVVAYPSSAAPSAELMINRSPRIEALMREISADRMRGYLERLVGFGTRHTLSDTVSDVRGIGAARRYIHDTFQQFSRECGGCLEVSYDPHAVVVTRSLERPTVNVVNVIARLPGRTDPNRIIVVLGHYDSCICSFDNLDSAADSPGANDDGSGTVVVMELARAFSKLYPEGLDATILFVPVAGEELGLLGSTALARKLVADTTLNVYAALTTDIAGNIRGQKGDVDSMTVRVFSPDPDDGPSRQLARVIEAAGRVYVPDAQARVIQRLDRIGRGGDHRPFWELGIGAVRFTESLENYNRQHGPDDTIDGVHFPYVAKVARLNAATTAELAMAPAAPRPRAMRRIAAGGGADWDLSWAPVQNAPDLAGYEVTIRRTTSPYIERVVPVGNVTQFRLLDTQADDLWIGVRSVDRDGHRSLISSFHRPEAQPSGR